MGIPLLKVGETDITDGLKKAEALSSRYESVFTDENLTAMPVMSRPQIRGIANLIITTNGVKNLLNPNLNPKKANGPELLLCIKYMLLSLYIVANHSRAQAILLVDSIWRQWDLEKQK